MTFSAELLIGVWFLDNQPMQIGIDLCQRFDLDCTSLHQGIVLAKESSIIYPLEQRLSRATCVQQSEV